MSDTGSMSIEEYGQLKGLLKKAIDHDREVRTEDTSWHILMAAQSIACDRYRALRWPDQDPRVPVPQSLRA